MKRARRGQLLGGICAGAAQRYQIDVTLLRLAAMLLALAWGLGIILYLAAWLSLPAEGERSCYETRSRFTGVHGDLRGFRERLLRAWQNAGQHQAWPLPWSRRWLALGLVAGGVATVLISLGALSWLSPLRALGIAALIVGSSMLISLRD